MSRRYYLGPWQWVNSPMPAFVLPVGADGGIDLGTLPAMAAGGAPRPGLLCWSDAAVLGSDYTLLGTGDVTDIAPSGAMLSVFQSLVGYRPRGNKLHEMILDCFIGGADPDGQTAPMPIMPGMDGWMDLHMTGHGRVKGERFEWGVTPHTAKIKQMLRKQFVALMADAQAGRLKDNKQHLRVMDFWCEKYKVDDWREFVPAALVKDVAGRVKHETTITESFNQADSTTLGPNLTWTQVSGTWRTVSNAVGRSNATNTQQYARADSDLSSADHYAQIKRLTTFATDYQGPCCRVPASGDDTFYSIVCDGTLYLFKRISGSQTNYATTSQAINANDIYKIYANGSTTKAYVNGVEKISQSDTSITGNIRAAITQYNFNADGSMDDFEAGDLVASGLLYTQLERGIRGLNRGMYTRWG